MVIKKAKANYFYNDTDHVTYHYETQANQVKILGSDGSIKSDIQEMLLNGKPAVSVSLTTLRDSGMYRLKNCTDAPVNMDLDKEYLMTVEAVGLLIKQTFFDNVANNLYIRPIYDNIKGDWFSVGKATADSIKTILDNLGDIKTLTTKNKQSVVAALNGLQEETNASKSSLAGVKTDVQSISKKLSTHNHDDSYLSLGGGDLTGSTSMANEKSFQGKNTSGSNVNIGKVDSTNNVVFGDMLAPAIMQAKNGQLNVSDGVKVYKVFHAGNMGVGSGLDADKVDGIEGEKIARLDVDNYLRANQIIESGKGIILKAPTGSSQAGSISFKDSLNDDKGKISVGSNGDLIFHAGTVNGHTMKSTGEMLSSYGYVLDSTERETSVKWRKNNTDIGIGFFLNNTTDRLGLHDWHNLRSIFTVDRSTGMTSFANHIAVQGSRIFVQNTAPANPEAGDIWFGI